MSKKKDCLFDHQLAVKELNKLESENKRLREALKTLIEDVQQYPAWERPCFSFNKAKAALDGKVIA